MYSLACLCLLLLLLLLLHASYARHGIAARSGGARLS
jgi:hypothetical protein